MIDLKAKPFYLNEKQIAWVNGTRDAMTDDEKAEQLFCPMLPFTDVNAIKGGAVQNSDAHSGQL